MLHTITRFRQVTADVEVHILDWVSTGSTVARSQAARRYALLHHQSKTARLSSLQASLCTVKRGWSCLIGMSWLSPHPHFHSCISAHQRVTHIHAVTQQTAVE